MKVVILAGGLGTRIAEESDLKPKPMIEIGSMPILWHIMKIYAAHGLTEFIVCLGYKGYIIKEFFANYVLHRSDVTLDLAKNEIVYHSSEAEPWKVTLVETGLHSMTGGRIKRVRPYLHPDESFCMTYGDGLCDVDIGKLIAFHNEKNREATLTVVRPSGRFGSTRIEGDDVTRFTEKPAGEGDFINGGFFVLRPEVLDRIEGDDTVWEKAPMESLAQDRQLAAFRHDGFWQPMDTLREKRLLENLWASGDAPWKVW
ncbi:glucose-1-phosphate cytidylyltransferase [Varunaivibrio sulfuroxidans]|uniref:Glucose-1-phosphate cytidylyltransferase n=1 Tax=Varunaivibrio sulfuroxidans TaxID=1773489 RepID=A0A4V2UP90_9PROT|nr:glucose-1-phosphate cytidylyltransferase [Varunaivibrio sulfuroxidans]TCS64981.1 glucose-1-phosphate cytidylyltransferase [Varunaivibrio sulfuroxidans]WES32205.1 glucose-1-phosphate cytidylyltransferase [Varunaivibrio sulfuroxidans]